MLDAFAEGQDFGTSEAPLYGETAHIEVTISKVC